MFRIGVFQWEIYLEPKTWIRLKIISWDKLLRVFDFRNNVKFKFLFAYLFIKKMNSWNYRHISIVIWLKYISLHKKWSFPLRISSVNLTKSAVSCGFGHIYWRNPSWKTSFFVQCLVLLRWFDLEKIKLVYYYNYLPWEG